MSVRTVLFGSFGRFGLARLACVLGCVVLWFGAVGVPSTSGQAGIVEFVDGVPSGVEPSEVNVDELRLELVPLRREQLEAASSFWLGALQEEVGRVQRIEVAILRSESEEEIAGLQSQLERVRARAMALVALAESVLNELELKGGDVAEGRRYLSRVVAAAKLADAPQVEVSGDPDAPPPGPAVQPWEVPIPKLRNQLLPMLPAQLEREVETWLQRVQERVELMVEAENRRIASTGEEEAQAIRDAEMFRQQRGLLIERAEIVLNALEAKGGAAEDIERHRRYLMAAGEQPAVQWFNPRVLVIQARAWLFSAQGGIALGIKLLQVIGILIAFWILSKIVARAARTAMGRMKRASGLLKDFVVGGVKKLVMLIGVIVAVATFGVNITPLVAALGAAGLVIGLALQGTLSNFASGLLILFYRPFDVGDVIDAADVAGKVETMTLVSTVVITFDNQQMIVPNNMIWNGVITNVTGRSTRRVDLTVGVDYRSDLDKTKRILEEMVKAHPKVLADPAPTIKLHEYADSSVNFIVRPWSKTSDYWDVYWDLQAEIKKRFDAEGISIPYPQHDINFNGPVEIVSREA